MPVGYYCYYMSINAFAFGLLANRTKRLTVFALLGALSNVETDLIHDNLDGITDWYAWYLGGMLSC